MEGYLYVSNHPELLFLLDVLSLLTDHKTKMPKKLTGENSKAVAAKERKNEKAAIEKAAKQKAEEDSYWADDDRNLAKKTAKKEDAEKKRLEALNKKKERDVLAAQEEQETLARLAKVNVTKVTQARIREETERREEAARKAAGKPEQQTHLSKPLEENINRWVNF